MNWRGSATISTCRISYDLAFYPDRQYRAAGRRNPHPAQAEAISLRPLTSSRIRQMIRTDYPNITGYFQAADIVNQVLNFGLPAAIDVQISGNDLNSDYRIASRLQDDDAEHPGRR